MESRFDPATSRFALARQGNGHDFVVVANRLPVDATVDGEGQATWQRSPGGLVTALESLTRRRPAAWIGWYGKPGPAPQPFVHDGIHIHPVALSKEEVDNYYEGQANATIWPLYHDCVEHPQFHRSWRHAYRQVNARFARAAARLAAPNGTVWIHDYHLQLVPALLRGLRPDLRIGFFLHIPFPPTELFLQMPLRTEIITGILGADLIGFQSPLAVNNFTRLAAHLAGAQVDGDTIAHDGRLITAASFPISIDFEELDKLARQPHIQQRAQQIRAELNHPRTLILGVDRLDYTKGITHRLTAYSELLATDALHAAQTVMVQVAVPSRQRVAQYRQLRERVEREVGRINGEHADIGRPAIHYLHQSYDREELVSLYLAADVMAVTPLRDGMNLVAKEYVATRIAHDGALVLSEFAGAAAELPQAHLVNPHDIEQIKNALTSAASHANEYSPSMAAMRAHLAEHDVEHWANQFLQHLEPEHAIPIIR